jgi:hypothetical protein
MTSHKRFSGRLVSALRRRLTPEQAAVQPPAPSRHLHVDPLDHLAEILSRQDLTKAELNPIGHRLDGEARAHPGRCADLLHAALKAHDGPVTPALNRLAIHALDAEWRRHRDNADKGRALRPQVRALERAFGEIPAVLLYRGALTLRDGDRQAAFALMHRAAVDSEPLGLPWMHIGAHSLRLGGHADWQDLPDQATIPGTAATVTWEQQPRESGKVCLLAGGDGAFFQAYGPDLHASLRRYDADCSIHMHVVNYTPGCARVIDQMDDPRLSVTSEPYAKAGDMAFYALARFYRLGEILERLNLPLYVTDLDNLASTSCSAALPDLQDLDIGLHSQTNQTWFPWWGPSAANTYIAATPAGREFADWIRAYSAARFQPGDMFRSWWFDQLMLNELEQVARERGLRVGTTRTQARTLTVERPSDDIQAIRAKLKTGAFSL